MKRTRAGIVRALRLGDMSSDGLFVVSCWLTQKELRSVSLTSRGLREKFSKPLTLRSKHDLEDTSEWSQKRRNWILNGTVSSSALMMPLMPSNLRTLTLDAFCTVVLLPGSLPLTLRSLELPDCYNAPLDGVLPDGLQRLVLGNTFAHSISGVLPNSLLELRFGDKFRQRLRPGDLPLGLQDLSFGVNDYSNTPIDDDVLPAGLQTLTLPAGFYHPLTPRTLPPNLLSLTLGSQFMGPIDPGTLPASLQDLTIDACYDEDIGVGVLPSGLKSLTLSHGFDCEINEGALPAGSITVTVCDCYDYPIPEKRPNLYVQCSDCPCTSDWY